ncbi:galactose-specific lectin nattectin-like [Gambusia affinis]|uniref:galactose-specific lectin nattectin-like n=1 Tax=Gambusia affinis TaxID=33528 RepID=UPI001CDB6C96|nr:galactose-specific lectin nattectin-like [Gambusia affinis]
MAAGLVFTLLLGLSFGLWDGADAAQMNVANCNDCRFTMTWNDGRCFQYVELEMTWAKAEEFCRLSNGNLASMRSINDYYFITNYTHDNHYGEHKGTWVGGYDSAEEGTWMWSDGSRFLFNHWGPGQPNNQDGNENCMVISAGGNYHMNDDICSKELPFICAYTIEKSFSF